MMHGQKNIKLLNPCSYYKNLYFHTHNNR